MYVCLSREDGKWNYQNIITCFAASSAALDSKLIAASCPPLRIKKSIGHIRYNRDS